MNAGYAWNLLHLLYDIHADVDPLFLLVVSSSKAIYDLVCNIHAGHELFHVAGHAKRLWRSNTCQDIAVLIYSQVPYHLHELLELLYIIYDLGLDKVGTCLHLLPKARSPELKGIGKGICSAAKEEPWLCGLYLLTALELPVIPHALYHGEQLYGVHVENTLCLRMISKLLMVSCKAQQVPDPKGRCTENVCLYAYTVPVTTGHLHHRLNTL